MIVALGHMLGAQDPAYRSSLALLFHFPGACGGVISLRHRSRRCPAGGHRIEVDAATVCLRRFITAFTMVIGLAAIAQLVHAAPPEDIRGYCSVHQSHRYRLICEQEEQEAKARLYRQVDLPYGIPRDIWYYCGTVYSSWRYMEICARDELRGKGLLEPR